MNSQVSVAFIASVLSALMFGVLAGIPASSTLHPSGAGFYAAMAVLCLITPVIGFIVVYVKPRARDWGWGIALSPFPGTIAFLLAALWVSIS